MIDIAKLSQFRGTGAISISPQGNGEIRQTGILHSIKTFFGFKSAEATNRTTIEAIRQAIHNDPMLALGHRRADELLNNVRGTITVEQMKHIIGEVNHAVAAMDFGGRKNSAKFSVMRTISTRLDARPKSDWPRLAISSLNEDQLHEWKTLVAQTAVSGPEPKGGWGSLDIDAAIKETEDTIEEIFAEVPETNMLAKMIFDRGVNLFSSSGVLKPKDECIRLAKQVNALVVAAGELAPSESVSSQMIVREVAKKNIAQMKALLSPELFTKLSRLGLKLNPNPLSEAIPGMSLKGFKKIVGEFRDAVVDAIFDNWYSTDELEKLRKGGGGGEILSELQSLVIDMAVAGLSDAEKETLRSTLDDSAIRDYMDNGIDVSDEVPMEANAPQNQSVDEFNAMREKHNTNAILQVVTQMLDQTLSDIGMGRA